MAGSIDGAGVGCEAGGVGVADAVGEVIDAGGNCGTGGT